jgi:hypothetical protein
LRRVTVVATHSVLVIPSVVPDPEQTRVDPLEAAWCGEEGSVAPFLEV